MDLGVGTMNRTYKFGPKYPKPPASGLSTMHLVSLSVLGLTCVGLLMRNWRVTPRVHVSALWAVRRLVTAKTTPGPGGWDEWDMFRLALRRTGARSLKPTNGTRPQPSASSTASQVGERTRSILRGIRDFSRYLQSTDGLR